MIQDLNKNEPFKVEVMSFFLVNISALKGEEEDFDVETHLVSFAMHTETQHATSEFERYVQDDKHYLGAFCAAYQLMNKLVLLPEVRVRVAAIQTCLEKKQEFYAMALEDEAAEIKDKSMNKKKQTSAEINQKRIKKLIDIFKGLDVKKGNKKRM